MAHDAYGFPARTTRPSRPPRLPAGLRAPVEARTWRELLHLMLNLPIGIFSFVYTVTMLSLGAGLLVTLLGVPMLALLLAGCRGLGVVERARARALLRHHVSDPGPVTAGGEGGFWTRLGARFKSGVSWRHVLYSLLIFPWGVFTFSVAVSLIAYGWGLLTYPLWRWVFPAYVGQDGIQVYGDGDGHGWYLDSPFETLLVSLLGLLVVLVTPWLVRGMTHVDRLLVSGLLGSSPLASRVSELESDRGVVVDTAAEDLRRTERDLYDGAQARLVSLAMELGLAKEQLRENPREAARMVSEAHGEVKLALQELRELARGIHPAILTDRGLGPALSAVAARCTVPADVTVDLPARPVPAIEGIAYFTVSELLQNVSKHSGARRASVDVWQEDGRLMILVGDDGAAGADPDAGSGLAGLAERLGAVDGVLAVDSPPGGPTSIAVELPWRA